MNNYNRKKDPIENRRLILDAAMQLVAEIGLEKLTLDAVAKRANLSKGGLLHHFPKKEALIEELFTASLEDYTKAIQAGQGSGYSPPIAYLKAAINDDPDDVQKISMRMLTQATMYNPHYIELMREWYRQHILPDPAKSTPQELAAILIADGIWYSNVFGIHAFTQKQRKEIANLFFKEPIL